MANFFNKLFSGLDFWDKKENQGQRDSFAQQDEEEKRRRQQQQAARSSVVQPNVAPPSTPGLSPTKPLVKVGSQSDFTKPTDPLSMFKLDSPLQKTTQPNPNQPPKPVAPPVVQPKPVTPQPQPVQPKPTAPAPLNAAEIRQKAMDYQKPKVQDVNNYYGNDLKVLQAELAKGDATDYHRVAGLMQSLDNRTKELKDFHAQRGENTSFKTARELQDTIKSTRGDWTKQNDQLHKFWNDVSANESGDFEQYLAEKSGKPVDPMMIRPDGAWKNGNGQNFAPDFSGDHKKVQEVQQRQKIADIAKEYGGIAMDQLGNRTVNGELERFSNASPEEQRKILKDYEEVLSSNEENYSANPDLKRKAEQAFMVYQTLLDSNTQHDNWHTSLNKIGDVASKFGGALLESPKHVFQSADVLVNQELLGKGDKGQELDKLHKEGKLSDEEYNKQMNEYSHSLDWVPDESKGTAGRLLTAAGTSADTVATFLPILSAAKGVKAGMVAETLAKEIAAEQGISRSAARVAAKETLSAFARDAGENTLKRTMAQEAIANGAFSGVGSLRTGEFDPVKTAEETALGTVIGGTAPAVGSKVGKFWSRFRGADQAAPEALEDVGRVTSRLEGSVADDTVRASMVSAETTQKIAELQKIIDDPSIPSFQKLETKAQLAELQSQADDEFARALGAGDTPLDTTPAFVHKQDVEAAITAEEDALNAKIAETPGMSDYEISIERSAAYERALQNVERLQEARSLAIANSVPDPATAMSLEKASQVPAEGVVRTADEVPLPDFNQAINTPLEKVDATTTAATGEAPLQKAEIAPTTDTSGNPALTTDASRAREMAAEGIAPSRGDSAVAAGETQRLAAQEAAAQEQVNQAAAPRTREQAANLISDDQLRADMMENFDPKQTMNLEATEAAAKQRLNNMSDDEIVAMFSQPTGVENPEQYLTAVNSIRRLERIGTPEAQEGIRNALDALAGYSSKSGQGLRVTQMLFENMPTSMKADYLIKKVGKAGVEMTDADRGMLTGLISRADEATAQVRALQEEARALLENGAITNKNMSAATKARIKEMQGEIKVANQMREARSGEAWDFYQKQMPKTALGKRAADVGRTMMLSSAAGRAFDLLSTTATATDDLITQGVGNLIGKGVNLVKAPGTVTDTIISPSKLIKGLKEGAGRFGRAVKGEHNVEDFMLEARKASRGDIQGGSGLRKVVRAFTEAPTELTRGLREQELFRQGMQEAAQQGLKGSARRAYANVRALVPSEEQLHQAVETQMKANMLHNNGTSRFLNGIAQSLDRNGKGWGAVLIRNQIMPFTSWVGGNLNRALTDKNVLFNTFKIIQSAARSDAQGIVDNLAKLGVNTGEAYAAGMLLTKAGIITDQDANGDSYGGLYFHIGDRYIPVAIAGTVSVPLILGNSIQKMVDAHDKGESVMGAFSNAATNGIVNSLQNAGVASVFGGDNTFQNLVNSLVSEGKKDPGDRSLNPFLQYGGDVTRQYIPGIGGDINAGLDYTSMNPTHEAPLTKVTEENPLTGRDRTNVAASEKNKTLAKIPILSQGLDRQEGKPAKDIIDRITKGNHETVKMVEEKQTKLTAAQEKKRRKEDDIPDTEEGITARVESGEFGNAIAGLNQQIDDGKKDKNVPKSKVEGWEQDKKRLQITMDGGYSPDIVKLYSSTGLTDWRAMADPESDEYDPETAGKLQEYDNKLTEAGVSKGKKLTETKYFAKGTKGRGGSGGSKSKGIATDIATNKQSFGDFSPIKLEKASFSTPQSVIPVLQKVADYDQSKKKKISVRRGA